MTVARGEEASAPLGIPSWTERPTAEEEGSVPPRALGVSVLALAVAAAAGLLWPEASRQFSGLVWLLALIPVFLLSYYRGWWGAAVAALLSMVALTAVEVVVVGLLGQTIEWQMYAFAALILVCVTLGSGVLSELLHHRKQLAMRMAYEDPLTGLANRRMIERDGKNALARARREDATPAVLFFDLIRFKRINDELGFGAGDETLTVVGRRVQNATRDSDTVARVGGDEFAALLPNCGGRDEASAVAERIRSSLWRPIKVAGQSVHLGARVGMALFPEDGRDFDELLTAASPAKREEGQGWRVLLRQDPEEEEKEGSALVLETELVEALEGGELGVHYQPVARIEDDAVVGVESLLRWKHPERGMLNAAAFVPAAERMGIIGELERELLEEAIAQAARWAESAVPIWTSVNLSLTSLEGPEGREALIRLVKEHGLPPDRLVVEVTERITARNPASARRHLQSLRDQGFRVAIDDFGTGHSSLAYFEQFPVDLVKVDRMFVGELAERGRKQRLVEGILGLAHGLDLIAVAEGAEQQEQLDWLREVGCDLYQGHLLARPCPASEVEAMLREGRLTAASEAAVGASGRGG